MNEMANAVDFHVHNQKQCIQHCNKIGNEYRVDFIRDDHKIYYGFSGFGDIFGFYVRACSEKYLLGENRVGINGEVSVYLFNPLEEKIFVVVDSAYEPSSNY